MQIAKHLAMAVIGLGLRSATRRDRPVNRQGSGMLRASSIDRQVMENRLRSGTTFRCGTATGCR